MYATGSYSTTVSFSVVSQGPSESETATVTVEESSTVWVPPGQLIVRESVAVEGDQVAETCMEPVPVNEYEAVARVGCCSEPVSISVGTGVVVVVVVVEGTGVVVVVVVVVDTSVTTWTRAS